MLGSAESVIQSGQCSRRGLDHLIKEEPVAAGGDLQSLIKDRARDSGYSIGLAESESKKHEAPTQQRKLACPYYKNSGYRCKRSSLCAGLGFPDTHRVK